jgi:hypothetical protein
VLVRPETDNRHAQQGGAGAGRGRRRCPSVSQYRTTPNQSTEWRVKKARSVDRGSRRRVGEDLLGGERDAPALSGAHGTSSRARWQGTRARHAAPRHLDDEGTLGAGSAVAEDGPFPPHRPLPHSRACRPTEPSIARQPLSGLTAPLLPSVGIFRAAVVLVTRSGRPGCGRLHRAVGNGSHPFPPTQPAWIRLRRRWRQGGCER